MKKTLLLIIILLLILLAYMFNQNEGYKTINQYNADKISHLENNLRDKKDIQTVIIEPNTTQASVQNKTTKTTISNTSVSLQDSSFKDVIIFGKTESIPVGWSVSENGTSKDVFSISLRSEAISSLPDDVIIIGGKQINSCSELGIQYCNDKKWGNGTMPIYTFSNNSEILKFFKSFAY